MARTKAFEEEAVLQKAIDLFWEKGYHGTSMDDLVKTMGINRGSLYSTFNNKQELFEKALQEYRRKNNGLAVKMLRDGEPTLDVLRKMFYSAVRKQGNKTEISRGCFIVNSATELANLNPKIQKIVKANNLLMVKTFRAFLKRMQEAKNLSKDKDLDGLANLLLVSYSGLRINAMMGIAAKANIAAIDTLLDSLK